MNLAKRIIEIPDTPPMNTAGSATLNYAVTGANSLQETIAAEYSRMAESVLVQPPGFPNNYYRCQLTRKAFAALESLPKPENSGGYVREEVPPSMWFFSPKLDFCNVFRRCTRSFFPCVISAWRKTFLLNLTSASGSTYSRTVTHNGDGTTTTVERTSAPNPSGKPEGYVGGEVSYEFLMRDSSSVSGLRYVVPPVTFWLRRTFQINEGYASVPVIITTTTDRNYTDSPYHNVTQHGELLQEYCSTASFTAQQKDAGETPLDADLFFNCIRRPWDIQATVALMKQRKSWCSNLAHNASARRQINYPDGGLYLTEISAGTQGIVFPQLEGCL